MSIPANAGLIDTTENCFANLINGYPGLGVHKLLAAFSSNSIPVERVQSWQRGDYFPSGLDLLQLRCFMKLAGYSVRELEKLDGDIRQLGFAICFGIIEAPAALSGLGYAVTGPQSLWRLVIHGGVPAPKAKKQLPSLLSSNVRKEVSTKQQQWRTVIGQHLASYASVRSAIRAAPATVPPVSPGFPIAFARQVAAMSALAGPLLESSELRQAVLGATRSGQDLAELIELLRRFLPNER